MSERDLTALNQDWSNYWQGRTGTESGTALVGVEKHPEIEKFWLSQLENLDKSLTTLDLCCGAGTVLKILDGLGFSKLTGADISASAIDIVSGELPQVTGVVTPADDMPFADGQFDLVVSQYGFEYGDFRKVIPEIARILKNGGLFLSLSHDTAGAIHQEVSEQIVEMTQIRDTGFVEAARALFKAAMTGTTQESNSEITQRFRTAQMKLFPLTQKYQGLAEYIYKNTQSMYNQHRNYTFEDINIWFDGIENDAARFLGRMNSMHASAVNQEKMQAMHDLFKAHHIDMMPTKSLPDAQGHSLGWVFQGRKA